MERFEHGGDVYAHPGVLDFSASVNPLGMPRGAREALRASVDACEAYPDPHCRALRSQIAAFEGVPDEWVLPCAGATDAITRLCQALRPAHALVCAPCYMGYEEALVQVGAEVRCHRLSEEDGFAIDGSLMDAMASEVRLVFLANPNNPTGRRLDRAVLEACLDRARATGAAIALDECFVDLTQHEGSTCLLGDNPHLVLVKALTKTYAIPGLRVGYALCSDGKLLGRMRRLGQPWAVSVPAQLAGVACLRDGDYLRQSRRLVASESEGLRGELQALGLQVVAGEANYLLFEGPEGLYDLLLDRGVLVRSCANFVGLGPRWYRVAVRAHDENQRLLAALREVLP